MIRPNFSSLADQQFDLLVVGGGIYGAWCAYSAALRGLKVGLVEQNDWGSGTSQASSKLIHGGLRYLEHYDFSLVRKALHERQLLNQMAPHRVRPLRFMIPNFQGERVGPLKFRAGLMLYDFLAGKKQPVAPHRVLKPKEVKQRWPFLQDAGLRAAFSYGDCVTDDSRLVLEVVAGAIEAGVVAINYAKYQDGVLSDQLGKCPDLQIKSRATLACVGPWLAKQNIDSELRPRLVMGVHLVMPSLGCNEAFLLTADDGRVFFAIPWYGRTLLGTTESEHVSAPESAQVRACDVEYLLRNANAAFDGLEWSKADVISSFAGLRTLQNLQGSASAVTRELDLLELGNETWAPIGGKTTSARVDSQHIITKVIKRANLPANLEKQEMTFPWRPPGDWPQFVLQAIERGTKLGLSGECAQSLAERYGARIEKVWELIEAEPNLAEAIHPELDFCKAELLYCARYEMAQNTDDLLRRRIPLELLLGTEQCAELHRQFAGEFGVVAK